jgi:hypothetical protein
MDVIKVAEIDTRDSLENTRSSRWVAQWLHKASQARGAPNPLQELLCIGEFILVRRGSTLKN